MSNGKFNQHEVNEGSSDVIHQWINSEMNFAFFVAKFLIS